MYEHKGLGDYAVNEKAVAKGAGLQDTVRYYCNAGSFHRRAWSIKVVALALATFLAACDGIGDGNINNVDYNLRGTWESTDDSEYYGKLKISLNTITITGYSEWQTYYSGGNDSKRPFRYLPKNAPLTCYTDEGELFIEYIDDLYSFPYAYYKEGQDKYLYFTFGGRPEALKLTGN